MGEGVQGCGFFLGVDGVVVRWSFNDLADLDPFHLDGGLLGVLVNQMVGAVSVGEMEEFTRMLQLVELDIVIQQPGIREIAKLVADDES